MFSDSEYDGDHREALNHCLPLRCMMTDSHTGEETNTVMRFPFMKSQQNRASVECTCCRKHLVLPPLSLFSLII